MPSRPAAPAGEGASFAELAARAARGTDPVAYVDNDAWEPGMAGPWLAYEIAFKRQEGKLAEGQSVPTDWLHAWTGPGQAMSSDQLDGALRWLDAGKPRDWWEKDLPARLNVLG
jgi:hypothetical protein